MTDRAAGLAAWLGLISIGGCAGSGSLPPTADCAEGARLQRRTELYLGLSIPGGGRVTGEDLARFLGEVVTPRFPGGFTVLDGHGQYLHEDGSLVREDSRILVILDDPGRAEDHIEAVRKAYEEAFRQESVLRVDSSACLSF
jgi:hypothetical protein